MKCIDVSTSHWLPSTGAPVFDARFAGRRCGGLHIDVSGVDAAS